MLKLLKETAGEIAFLTALGGGFWALLEPPVGLQSGVFTGYVGASVLATTLCVRAILNLWSARRGVTIAVMAVATAALIAGTVFFASYIVDRSNLVFSYGTGPETVVEVVRGTRYHAHKAAIKQANLLSDEELLSSAGGPAGREHVWTRESIIEAERTLARGYMLTALMTLLATMFFVEVLRLGTASGKSPARD